MCVKRNPTPWGELGDLPVDTCDRRPSRNPFPPDEGNAAVDTDIQTVFALGRRPGFTVGDSDEWNPECEEVSGTSVINVEL
jgi:hypothetical protein